MAEVTPSLLKIDPFDADLGASVYYTFTGSKATVENNLRITDKSTGLAVYDFSYSGTEKVHHIPPAELVNGKTYIAKIRVKYLDETYSPYSNEVEFLALKRPVLDIENIDGGGYVYNSDITFIARYTQDNGEVVKTYRFHLYDEQEDLIQSYPLRYPTDAGVVLEETVKGLEKNKGYFIECVVVTENGFVWSQKERFIPIYLVPSIHGVVQTANVEDDGFVQVTANLKQLLGSQVRATNTADLYVSDNYEYEDQDWVIIPSDNPLIYKNLGMNRASDFVVKVWCKNIPDASMFLELSPKDETGIPIYFWKYSDRIMAVKHFNGLASRHRSNIIEIPDDAEFMLYVRAIEHRIDLEVKLL
ncbi:hypothetical protein V7094_15500 [Priestia megaterium]|uniref:hypothetical protein n=1 Tax=Priestia megaterium TaxID=1404 RepID=UPI002FFEB032